MPFLCNMIRSLLFTLLAGFLPFSIATAQTNIAFVGQLDYQQLRNSDLSNLWGYTDELGNEYAIVGVNGSGGPQQGGVSIVDLSDPTQPQEIFFVPGPSSIWREVKVWGDHAYITTEAENGGVTIVDLSPLPQNTTLPYTVFLAADWTTSHSLFIDENGRMYIFGSSRGNGGAIMYDLTADPMAPVEVGEYDQWYVHDGYARGDTLYAAHIYDGFFTIVDVSDPAAPQLLGSQTTPSLFTHNVWLDDSGDHIFTTDEKTNAFVGSYDISDPTDIIHLDQLQSDAGSGAVPHNTYWLNDYLVTSYYTYGVTIYDALRPDNLVEVGHYDTSPLNGEGFDGAWGVYPFFGSERLIISDIQQGLFILDPTYVRACWLEGTVTDAVSGSPVPQVSVSITGIEASDATGFDGTYATGYHTAGTYSVTFTASGYEPLTVNDVALVNGQLTLLDVVLDPLPSFTFQGTVIDAVSGDPIGNALVQMQNELYWFTSQTDGNGNFTISNVFADEYDVIAGSWGWVTTCLSAEDISSGSNGLVIELEPGYYDDAELDLGWTISGNAQSGIWERDEPIGTSYLNQPSNPGSDVDGDCGGKAFVTGNGGGGAGDDDVDDGNTVLLSPVFDATGMLEPHVTYYRWFFNSGGSGQPNDQLVISLLNGNETVVVETIGAGPGTNNWQQSDINIAAHLQPTATMQLRVAVADQEPGHLVEAGFDLFRVQDMGPIGIDERDASNMITLWPNPNDGNFQVTLDEAAIVQVTDAMGRAVGNGQRLPEGRSEVHLLLAPGAYFLRCTFNDGHVRTARLIVR